MNYNKVKTCLENIGFSVYKMDGPIAIVGNEKTGIPICAKTNRFQNLEKFEETFRDHFNNGLRTVYLYKVMPPDEFEPSFIIRASSSLDMNDPLWIPESV